MSSKFNLSFKDFIPVEIYDKYFDVMTNDETVYICIIQNDSQVNAVYLEKPDEDADISGIVRVFFHLEDLRKYGKQVSLSENIPHEFVKRWEMKWSAMITYITTI
jgi:hypothetical protein